MERLWIKKYIKILCFVKWKILCGLERWKEEKKSWYFFHTTHELEASMNGLARKKVNF